MAENIKVLYFGAAKDAAGKAEEMFAADDTDSLGKLLTDRYPALSSIPFRMAQNRTLLKGNSVLNESDVIAILPPFQGG
jgi:molybdopterin converting factor small subunit